MFLLKSLGNIVFGNSDNSLIHLPSGQLFYLNPSATKQSSSLLFRDCSAAILKTSTKFNYTLLVSRIYEDGEQDLAQDDDGLQEEFSFLIDPVLLFGLRQGKPLPSIVWADPADETSTCAYQFVPDPSATNDVTVRLFEEIALVCAFERSNGKAKSAASEDELQSFLGRLRQLAFEACLGEWKNKTPAKRRTSNPFIDSPQPMSTGTTAPSTPSSANQASKAKQPSKLAKSPVLASSQESLDDASEIDSLNDFEESKKASEEANDEIPFPFLPKQFEPVGSALISVMAQLYIYDMRASQFMLIRETVAAKLIKTDAYAFSLAIYDGSVLRIAQPVSSDMCPLFHAAHSSFVWVLIDHKTNNPLYSWSLKFDLPSHQSKFIEFQRIFSSCLYETNNNDSFSKIKPEDQDYLVSSLADQVALMDVSDDSREQSIIERERDQAEADEAADAEDDDPESGISRAKFESEPAAPRESEKNSLLSVGFSTDRSFVVRGNKIGVFRHTNSDGLEFSTTINNVRRPDGTPFSPAKIMLHKQDSSLLMMSPSDRNKIFRMDLERGRVVDEWNMGENTNLRDMTPNAKYSQLESTDTLIGLGHNSVFRVDPRLSGVKRVEQESKTYSSIKDLRVAATTAQGRIAVASDKGTIRLYNNLGQMAKTELPGFGDPIIGIDTAENGKYILATCATYLMFIDTEIPEKGGKLGYDTRMGKQKSVPKRLQLKPEHVAWMGQKVSFTPARFDAGTSLEKLIVTSSGPYVISWNLRRVKHGHLYDYNIKKYSEDVVSENFRYDSGRSIVVALQEDVEMLSASRLRTPMKSLKSRSSIVNSPY